MFSIRNSISSSRLFKNVAAAGLLGIGVLAQHADAATVSYTIDSSQSFYRIVNIQDDGATPPSPLGVSTILGTQVIPQVPGAAKTSLSGSIVADLTGGLLTFNGLSTIALDANPLGPFTPAANPGIDNLGFISNGNTALGFPISVVIRDLVFTIQSGTATDGALPNLLTQKITSGYQVNSFTGQTSLVGGSGPDQATSNVSLSTVGNTETLIIPVTRLPAQGTPGQIYFTGQIVATRAVPEASSVMLASLGFGSVALLWARKKRSRQANG